MSSSFREGSNTWWNGKDGQWSECLESTMLMWHKDWFDSAEKCTLTVLWSKNECMRFSSCCCICVQAQHLGAGGEHPGWQADFGVWAKVSVAASWGALRVLWVISLDFYLCIHFFSLACFYILAPILKSLKHVCSVPLPPFTFLSCVLVLNYIQCLFLWVLVFTHTFIPPHPPFVSLNSSSLLPNWKKKICTELLFVCCQALWNARAAHGNV